MQDDDAKELVWRLIEEIRTCMMITHCKFPTLRARPMRGISDRDRNAIWFFSDRDSAKKEEVSCDAATCLTYADRKSSSFVSLSGPVEIIDDSAKIEELWNDHLAAYWPDGPLDPNLVLLHFTPEFGEYWESPGNALIVAIKFIEAKITGSYPDLGKNAKVSMN